MNARAPDPLFTDWRQRCLDDALDLVDRTLFDGSARTQPGLRPAWQQQLREALLQPRVASVESGIGGIVTDTLSGVTLLSDDEISQAVQCSRIVQALEHEADVALRELAARTLVWHREARMLGYPNPLLLEPATLTETLDRALQASVPFAPRRLGLLQELQPALVREAAVLYQRQSEALAHNAIGSRTRDLRALPGHAPDLQAAVPLAQPLQIDPAQVPALFERLETRAGLGEGLRSVMQTLCGMAAASVAADPLLLKSTDNPLWRLVDRLVALAQLDTAGLEPGKLPLHQRLAPLVDALHRAPQPLLARHYEQALFHLERLAGASLPDPAAPGQEAQLLQAARRAELQPLVQAQVAEQLREHALLPEVAQFLLGDWARVIAQTSAIEGVEGAGPQRWTGVIAGLVDAARLDRSRPLSPAALDCLVLEARDGLQAIGEAPARITRETEELRGWLAQWPRRPAAPARPADADPAEAAAEAPVEASAPVGSADIHASDWMYHADLATVPVAMDDSPDTEAWRDRELWIAGLAPGDLCRTSLQGRWTTVRLDWISDRNQFYAFSRLEGTPFCASRRVLERMRGEGLITTIPPGHWLQEAVDSLPEDEA